MYRAHSFKCARILAPAQIKSISSLNVQLRPPSAEGWASAYLKQASAEAKLAASKAAGAQTLPFR
jgi:hypothetical protein